MADKPVKANQTEKPKPVQAKAPEKAKAQPKKDNQIMRWWHETIGELRKVSWPTTQDAWRLTKIVLLVMLATSVFLGSLDFLFSRLIALLVKI